MITLRMPKGDSSVYLKFVSEMGAILGPYSLNGEYSDIVLKNPEDFIHTTEAMFGENNVDHVKTTGLLYGNPLAKYTRPSPERYYPNKTILTINGQSQELHEGVISGNSQAVIPANASVSWLRQWRGNLNEMTYYFGTIYNSDIENGSTVIRQGTNIVVSKVVYSDIRYNPKIAKFEYKMFSQQSLFTVPPGSKLTWASHSEHNLATTFSRGKVVNSYSMNGTGFGIMIPNSLSVREMRETLSIAMSHLSHVPTFSHKHPGTLALEASKDISANGANMYEFLIELRNPKQLIPKLKNLGTLKNAAENYLTLNYGILPTISDLKEIFGAFSKARYYDKNKFSIVTAADSDRQTSSRDVEFSSTSRVKLAIGNNDSKLEEILTSMENIGMLPTFSNLWDLIPFSFVIDWFIDVGDVLENIDQRLRLDRLNIQFVTQSSKTIGLANVATLKDSYMSGELQQVRYSRWTTNHSPVPPLFEPKSPTVQNHWLEAGALIIALRK